MFRKFLPKETKFFDHFDAQIELVITGCKEFLALAEGKAPVAAQAAKIKGIEHQADQELHKCHDALHKTFITPMDRELIQRLAKRLDDIIDSVDAAAMRIDLYEITEIRPEARDMAQFLVAATTEIAEALKLLPNTKNAPAINERCIKIYDIENNGDAMLRAALARLFKEEKDAVMIIKWKEIHEHLEKAIDRCEDVANIIQTIVIEAS